MCWSKVTDSVVIDFKLRRSSWGQAGVKLGSSCWGRAEVKLRSSQVQAKSSYLGQERVKLRFRYYLYNGYTLINSLIDLLTE